MTNQSNDQSLESLEGVVQRVAFVNGFFSINRVNVASSSFALAEKEIDVVGHFGRLQAGHAYRFLGHFKRNPRHQWQFVATSYRHLN